MMNNQTPDLEALSADLEEREALMNSPEFYPFDDAEDARLDAIDRRERAETMREMSEDTTADDIAEMARVFGIDEEEDETLFSGSKAKRKIFCLFCDAVEVENPLQGCAKCEAELVA